MSRPTFFQQECPTCGRRLEICVEHLGRTVACRHCRGQLVANDPANITAAKLDSSVDLLKRVDELLAAAAVYRVQTN